MSPAPRISVVIDNYNYGKFLPQAIESVLGQDLDPEKFEIVVSDDGSTDDSRDILKRYSGRVRALLGDHQGQAETFNRGIGAAKGEIVALMDSDDVWMPGKLSAVLARFDDEKVGCVQHRLQDVAADLSPLRHHYPAWPKRYLLEDFLEARTQFTATSGLAYRKKLLEKALPIPKDLFYYLDDFLTVRTMFFSEVANIPEVLGLHRVHGGNWCAGGLEDPAKIEVDFRMREIFSDNLAVWLKEAGKSLSPRYLELERLELLRRRVLYEALKGRPAEAWNAWWEGRKGLSGSAPGRFRIASLLLAVLSPTLYLRAYSAYSSLPPVRALRHRLFPGPK